MKNLVLLVQFSDVHGTKSPGEFDALFNQPGYAVDGARGSVSNYFAEVSYGQLRVDSFVIPDWITLPHPAWWYGRDNGGVGQDWRPRDMVKEALAILDASGFDFSPFDANGDGWVDSLTVVHAGWGQEWSGNNTDWIWSHKWAMTNAQTYDGVSMLYYCTVPEYRGADTNAMRPITRIGVICHEMGHLLGLPDLYDSGNDSWGAGYFCLMAYGNWNGDNGTLPAHMSAWCKKTLGWTIIWDTSAGFTYTIGPAEANRAMYQHKGVFPSSQYFLIENRQGNGTFDDGLPGSARGLLIWHIDETQPNNDDQTHYKVDLEEASGIQHLELNGENGGDDADYFRQGNNTVFSPLSTPDNRSYSGKPLGFDLCNVSAAGLAMTFYVMPLVTVWGEFDFGHFVVPPYLTNVVAIASGWFHNLALKSDGTVVVWGDNSHDQTNMPPGLANVVAIAAGIGHNLALKSDGTVVAWGDNSNGQTNVPPGLANVVAIAGGGFQSVALKSDGTVVTWGSSQTNVPTGLTNVVAIAAGTGHCLAVKSDGTVVAWGYGTYVADPEDGINYGQAIVPPDLTNVVAVAGSRANSLALKGDGTVVVWGDDEYCVTNIPVNLTNVVAIAESDYDCNLALKADGTVVAWGRDPVVDVPPFLTNVVAIATKQYFGTALKNNGFPFISVPPRSKGFVAGGNVTLQVMALGDRTLNYQWKKGGVNLTDGVNHVSGVHLARLTITNALSTNVGNYTVVVGNASGSITSSPAALTLIYPPAITTQPPSRTNLAASTATFTVAVSGTAPFSYQWKKNNVNLTNGVNHVSGADSATLTMTNVLKANEGSYTIVITNAAGSVTSAPSATLTVIDPVITTQPASRTNTVVTTATFSVAVAGTTPFSYQWRKDDVNLTNGVNNVSGATSATLVITNVLWTNRGSYTIVITNMAGSVTSAPAVLTVLSPPEFITQPASCTNNAGTTATFTVVADGTLPLAYLWKFNSIVIDGPTNATLTITNVQQTNAGTYQVTVYNGFGYRTTDPATLTVIDPPVITAQPASRTNIWDTAATFAANVSGTGPLSYQWQFSGTNLSDGAHIVGSRSNCLVIPNVVFADAGDYRLMVTNLAGSATSSVATLTVQPASISLTNGDVLGSSSFATKLNWNSSAAPAAGNYYYTAGWLLRTPPDAGDYNFQGDTLQVDPKTGGGSALTFKGTGLITVNTLKLNGATVGNGIDAVARLAGNITNLAGSCFDCGTAARSFNVSAALSGAAPLTNLNGVVVYSGANASFTGKMVAATNGIIQVDSQARLGANPASFTADQLLLDNGTLQSAATFALDDGNRGITLGAAGGTFDTATNTTLTIPNPISGSGALTKKGAGTLVLSGTNTFTGPLNVDSGSTGTSDGILRITNSAAIASAASPIQVRNNNNGSSTLALDGSSGSITVTQDVRLNCRLLTVPWLENLSGTNTLAGNISYAQGGNQFQYQSDSGRLELNGWSQYQPTSGSFTGARTNVFTGSGDFLVTGAILDSTNGAPIHLLKLGTGVLTLAGTNNYAGMTTLSEGTLRVTGSINSTGGVSVVGGTLSGTGAINDNLTVQAGGVLSPGYEAGSIGSLAVNGSLTNCGVILLDLNKAGSVLTNDTITGLNTIAYGGTLQLNVGGAPLAAGDSFKLFYAASYAGAFTNIVPPVPGPGLVWDTSNLAASGTLAVGAPPMLISQPVSRTNESGTTATFTVEASGTPPLNYQWRKGGSNLVGGTEATLTLTNVGRRDSGVYAVLVTNVCDSVLSSNATLVVRVRQRLGMPVLLPDGTCVIVSGDEDGGLLSTNDLPNFEVYAGTNLVDWILLTNDLMLTNGQLWLRDTSSTNFPLRFYRIIEH